MRDIRLKHRIGFCVIIIGTILLGFTPWASAGDGSVTNPEMINQGVPLTDVDRVRQETRPFVPINELLVLDPVRQDIILLLPPRRVERAVQPEQPEVETEKRVILESNFGTEIGTVTIKTK